MASVAPSERQTVPAGLATARPSFRHDAPGLASFRALAALDYDRSLSRLVEGEIIPRLMLAHAIEAPPAAHWAVEPEDVDALAALALEVNADALLARVEAILARGTPVDSMMVDLLAPAARLLGTYWEEDRCDFVAVTMGLWRLQEWCTRSLRAFLPIGGSPLADDVPCSPRCPATSIVSGLS